jgi:hypothetical protein
MFPQTISPDLSIGYNPLVTQSHLSHLYSGKMTLTKTSDYFIPPLTPIGSLRASISALPLHIPVVHFLALGLFFYPVDGGRTFLRNVDILLPDYMA